MESKKWVVAVISTDYDLPVERKQIITMLTDTGFKVSAFELPEFPLEPHRNSHDVCLDAIDRSDIVVLIINKRYGGFYLGDKRISITEKEFQKAIGQNKLVISCIAQQAWDEKEKYNRELKKYHCKSGKKGRKVSKKTENEFASTYCCSYVDNVETIQFINRIRKMPTDNYLCFYSNVFELSDCVKAKLSGFSRYICELLVQKQCDKIMASSDGIGIELGIEQLLRNNQYYVSPLFKYLRGNINTSESSDICDIISLDIDMGKRSLIIGKAGSGKSVTVSKLFLEIAQSFLLQRNNIYRIPFFISLRNKGNDYHFDIKKYIEDCLNEYLNKEMYPLFSISDINAVFFIDGFDELCDSLSEDELDYISSTDMVYSAYIVSSRSTFAQRYLTNQRFMIKFDNIISLLPWDISVAEKYIRKFCFNSNLDENKLVDFIIYEEACAKIYTSPLLLTILLWLIKESEIEIPCNISDQSFLLKKSLQHLVSRELGKAGTYSSDVDIILKKWAYVAWKIFSSRSKKQTIKLDEINELARNDNYSLLSEVDLFKPELVFDINPITHIIKGTYHEQFLEYLTALSIVEGCLHDVYPYPNFLWHIIRPEINAMIEMEYCSRSSEEREIIYGKFWDQYFDGLMRHQMVDALKQIQSLYQISKLNAKNSEKCFQVALMCEDSIVIKPSLFFNAVKKGNMEIEEAFLQELKSRKELADNNRGFHLAYYGDRIYSEMPYLDNDVCVAWTNTYNSIIKHFERTEVQYYYIRRLDLFMLIDFMRARKSVEPVSISDLERIREIIATPGTKPDFDSKVKFEYNNVIDQYIQISSENLDSLKFI